MSHLVRYAILSTCLAICLAGTAAFAQNSGVTLPSQVEPRQSPREIPIPQADLELTIPAQPRAPERRAVDELRFPVRQIVIEGGTVYPPDMLAQDYGALIGDTVGLSSIVEAAEKIEARYRADGYVLTRAFVPPQRVGDGMFRIQIVEGYLGRIVFDGGSEPVRERIRAYMRRAFDGRPVNVKWIERGLLLAGDLSGVLAAGTLAPGDAPGASDLSVRIVEKPVSAGVTLGNRGSKFQGPWSLSADASYSGLLGLTEQLGVTLTTVPNDTREMRQVALRYAQPIGGDGLTFGWDTNYSWGWPGHTLKSLRVNTVAWRGGPRLSYPVLRSRRENLTLDSSLFFANTRTLVGDTLQTNEQYTAGDFRVTYTQVGFLQGATVASVGYTRGLGLGSTEKGNAFLSRTDADPHFGKWTAELRRIQILPENFSVQWVGSGQVTSSALFAGEEFALGGARFGRGYDPSELTGRNAFGQGIDVRYGDLAGDGWQPYIFYDSGWAWNRRTGGASHTQFLSSTGVGVRVQPDSWLTGGLEFAKPLTRAPGQAEGERPWRVLMDVSARF
jgi:hemolysin activation/secretion protein